VLAGLRAPDALKSLAPLGRDVFARRAALGSVPCMDELGHPDHENANAEVDASVPSLDARGVEV
jgi:hypothetical protein